jgi:hypothetical protein
MFTGGFSLGDVPQLFNYSNFVPVISFTFLFLSIKNLGKINNEEQEKYLISVVITIFIFYYVLKFFFVERLLSLYTFSVNSLPDSVTDFFPFDWYDISNGYGNFRSDFDPGWYKL